MATRVPERGDLSWVRFDPVVGHRQGGHRPAFVLSPRTYNQRTGLALVCPVTTKARGYAFEVALPDDSPISGVVVADQIRTIDWKARAPRFSCTAPRDVVSTVLAKSVTLLM